MLGDLNVEAGKKLRDVERSLDPAQAESYLFEVLSICDRAIAVNVPGDLARALHDEARRNKAEAALEIADRAIRSDRLDIASWMVETARSTEQLAKEVEETAKHLEDAVRDRSKFKELSAKAGEAVRAQEWAVAVNQLQLAIEEGQRSSFVQPDELARLRRHLDLARLEVALAQAAAATDSGSSEQMEHALELLLDTESKLTHQQFKHDAATRIERLRRELGDAQYNEAQKAEQEGFLGPALTLYRKALNNLSDPTKREDTRRRLEAIQTQLAVGQVSGRHMLLRRGDFQVGSNREGDQNPLRTVTMNEFLLIDTYLVTNEDYKKFVDAGGYLNDSHWHEDALPIRGEFVDTTGKPGPAGWARGGFDDSLAKYPVTGISWYEAGAYAKFAGKRLPTPDEWEIAAGAPRLGETPLGDYPFGERGHAPVAGVKEPREVGTDNWDSARGIPRDMGNNVAEWTALRDGGRAQVRGAEPGLPTELYYRYARRAKVSVAPLSERSLGRGFRCIGEIKPESGDGNDE